MELPGFAGDRILSYAPSGAFLSGLCSCLDSFFRLSPSCIMVLKRVGGTDVLKEKMKTWRHVFKLDPNRPLSDRVLENVCTSGTDAVIVGGTDGITYENSRNLIERVMDYPVMCVQEISREETVVIGVDGYLVPVVLNAGSLRWVLGSQHRAVKKYGDWIPWEAVIALGYIVMNPESKVAKLTESQTQLSDADVKAYARLAERIFGMPTVYVEYSGAFGDEETLRAASSGVNQSRLIYGGGITRKEEAPGYGPLGGYGGGWQSGISESGYSGKDR